MIAMEALKEVMKIREIRPAVLCDRLGIKSNVLSERFKQKNVSVTKLNEMLRLMDCKIVVVPRDSRVPEGGLSMKKIGTFILALAALLLLPSCGSSSETGSQENEETSDPITEQGFYEDDLVKTDIITMEENRRE